MPDYQRLFHPDDDAILQASTVLTTWGALPTMPIDFLHDQQKTKAVQWERYVVGPYNDRIDINVPAGSGVSAVSLTHGSYDTPALYAAMVQARLEAAEPVPSWDVSWNVAAANKFRIRDGGGAPVGVNILWNTGANKHRSAGIDLGYDVTADDTGGTSYTADNVSYQSRKYVLAQKADGSNITAEAAIILEHTATVTGAAAVASKVTIQGNATDSWASPSFSEDFGDLAAVNAIQSTTGRPTSLGCVEYFASSQAFAFFLLTIDDVQNPTGITALGRYLLGLYDTVSVCISSEISTTRRDMTTGADASGGQSYAASRGNARVMSFGWDAAEAADDAILHAFFKEIPVRRQWFFDAYVGSPANLYYGYFLEPPTQGFVPVDYWDWNLTVLEAF